MQILFLLGVALVLSYNLSDLLPGASNHELASVRHSDSWLAAFGQIVWLPYYLLVATARLVIEDGVLAARVVSLSLALVAAGSFLAIAKRYWSLPIALAGTSLLVGNSWFLQLARVAEPAILGVCLISLFWWVCLRWRDQPTDKNRLVIVWLVGLIGWFVPILAWLALIATVAILSKQKIGPVNISQRFGLGLGLSSLLAVVLILTGLINDQQQLVSLMGLSSPLPNLAGILNNSLDVMSGLIWHIPAKPASWLANLPILDIFGVCLVGFGIYHFLRVLPAQGRSFSFQLTLASLLLLGLGGGVFSQAFALSLPLLGLLMLGGLVELSQLWRKIFPANPLAKSLMVVTLVSLISLSLIYQGSRYFVAWSRAPATKEIYSANINQ